MNLSFKPYRCAVYFTPPLDSEWWHAGNQWLGRCLETNTDLAPLRIPNVEPDVFLKHTAEPRRYGWHATLKAPFVLDAKYTLADLALAMQRIANELPAFTLPALRVTDEDGFISLRPSGNLSTLNAVAAACVTRLHTFAAPLSQDDLMRRRKVPLTPQQDRLLVEWGYPWVLDQFRFHFSLTGPTSDMDALTHDCLFQASINHFGALAPCPFHHLSLFIEPTPGADFRFVQQMELRG